MEYIGHKKVCIPDEQFDFNPEEKLNEKTENQTKVSEADTGDVSDHQTSQHPHPEEVSANASERDKEPSVSVSEGEEQSKKPFEGFICELCQTQFDKMVQYEKHRSICLHSKNR